MNECMGSQYLSVTHIYTDTQSHKWVQMVEFSVEYGNTWVFGTLVLRCQVPMGSEDPSFWSSGRYFF